MFLLALQCQSFIILCHYTELNKRIWLGFFFFFSSKEKKIAIQETG